jgi:hypothetical protein
MAFQGGIMKRLVRAAAGVLAGLLVTAPAFAGHNEWVASKKVLGVKVCYAHFAEAHAIAVQTFFPLVFQKSSQFQLTLLNPASASASVSTQWGKASASSFSSGCSCGGKYSNQGFALASPGGRPSADLALPSSYPDSIQVDVVDIVPGTATAHVSASLYVDPGTEGVDTLAFFAYPDTNAAKADVNRTGVGALRGGRLFLKQPGGIVTYPAVAGGNLFQPLPKTAPTTTLAQQNLVLIDDTYSIAIPDTNVVLATYGGGSKSAAQLAVVPAYSPPTLAVLTALLLVAGWWALRRRRSTFA